MDISKIDEIYSLMINLFDNNEIRPKQQLVEFLKSGKCKIVFTTQNQIIESTIIYFEIDDFIIIEYFFINPLFQGKGRGSIILKEFIDKCSKTVLLEVETVDDKIKQRRVDFYKQLGFYLNDNEYYMPSYLDDSYISLNIMSYPSQITDDYFQKSTKLIHKTLYSK